MALITDLIRYAYLPDVTLGRWYMGGIMLWTLEEPWRRDPDGAGGQRREGSLRESCIPDGDYDLVPHNGALWQGVWRFQNPALGVYAPGQVPAGQRFGRDAILAHSGVDVNSILGCVLVGMSVALVAGRWTVNGSKDALERMRKELVIGTPHKVRIRPSSGTSEVWK